MVNQINKFEMYSVWAKKKFLKWSIGLSRHLFLFFFCCDLVLHGKWRRLMKQRFCFVFLSLLHMFRTIEKYCQAIIFPTFSMSYSLFWSIFLFVSNHLFVHLFATEWAVWFCFRCFHSVLGNSHTLCRRILSKSPIHLSQL